MSEAVLRGEPGPRTLLERWQGPPPVNKEDQCKPCCPLFSLETKRVSEDLSLTFKSFCQRGSWDSLWAAMLGSHENRARTVPALQLLWLSEFRFLALMNV